MGGGSKAFLMFFKGLLKAFEIPARSFKRFGKALPLGLTRPWGRALLGFTVLGAIGIQLFNSFRGSLVSPSGPAGPRFFLFFLDTFS